MTLVSDLRDAAEFDLDRFGFAGARRLVAPRPARRLLNKDGLLKKYFKTLINSVDQETLGLIVLSLVIILFYCTKSLF